MNIWAFNKADQEKSKEMVYQSVKSGKSRFGWSQKDEHNLKIAENWTEWHSKQLFLLKIQKGDWIVHVNTPKYGRCIAAQVLSPYDFDGGLNCDWGKDFRHYFDVDVITVIEFDRRDKNILPSVNLNPRQRYHRIYAVDDFLKSIDNLKNKSVILTDGETKEIHYLKDRTSKYLKEISSHIHEMHRSKQLERFMASVFRKLPDVEVIENGFGWKTDHGADLIITLRSRLGNLDFENTLIVQIKSFGGDHNDLDAVIQVKNGIKEFNADAGMIITTAERTETLENCISEISKEIDRPIELLAGEDVAKFVIKNAPELLFRL